MLCLVSSLAAFDVIILKLAIQFLESILLLVSRVAPR